MLGKITKNLIVLSIVGALMVNAAWGQEQKKKKEAKKDKLFIGLTISYAGLNSYETYQTINAYEIAKKSPDYSFWEFNPIGNSLLEHKSHLIAFKAVETVGTAYLLQKLRKKNKVLAYITVIGLNLVKGYFVYHNYNESRKFLREVK